MKNSEPKLGIEPRIPSLQVKRSSIELYRQVQGFRSLRTCYAAHLMLIVAIFAVLSVMTLQFSIIPPTSIKTKSPPFSRFIRRAYFLGLTESISTNSINYVEVSGFEPESTNLNHYVNELRCKDNAFLCNIQQFCFYFLLKYLNLHHISDKY